MAWLNATPKPPDDGGKAKKGPPPLSRIDKMKKDGYPIRLPPNPVPHITDRLREIGWVQSTGMGKTAISWAEIDAWCNRVKIDLAPWESRLIRRLSEEYLAEERKAESETCPAPWKGKTTQAERDASEAFLDALLG